MFHTQRRREYHARCQGMGRLARVKTKIWLVAGAKYLAEAPCMCRWALVTSSMPAKQNGQGNPALDSDRPVRQGHRVRDAPFGPPILPAPVCFSTQVGNAKAEGISRDIYARRIRGIFSSPLTPFNAKSQLFARLPTREPICMPVLFG